ncbi:NrfJ [Nitrosomonas halophila]|uniref:NrfJ n=1 Tax=Nitrosomonas halophila TaxID=44576 RepID=A0A1H3DJ23_9PROT|nr:NrfJ [Nitrosomonas halophila]SDX66493.1 hypothetical protein SAMN05421881_100550 [Nitrosomonas halophila]
MKLLRMILATALVTFLASLNPLVAHADNHSANAAALPSNEGIVVSSMDTTGYTYIELSNGAKKFWIAAPATKVKNGDHIRFVENMTMHNFTSKTLNRTFDKLIFVTSTQVKVAQ